jgi:hypothetical protein
MPIAIAILEKRFAGSSQPGGLALRRAHHDGLGVLGGSSISGTSF